MRIVAGEHGGRRLVAPRGTATRPTADRVREAVFSIVGPVDGLDVLDLFAGSGALGLEALSRGAATATLVDRSPRALAAIRANVAALGVQDRVRVVPRDWRVALTAERAAGRRYGLCLLDPPYTAVAGLVSLFGPALAPVLDDGATLVIEHPARSPSRPELTDLLVIDRTDRVYGDTAVSVLRLGAAAAR
jgi:16S rRNA (guanine966-N2)-methyltransferase